MTVGSLVYATKSGLGNLAKMLYDGGIIDKVYIPTHKRYETHYDWYKTEDICRHEEDLLACCNTIFILETVIPNQFDWSFVERAKYAGKRLVLMPMYESTIRSHLSLFDVILCPSELDMDFYKDFNSHLIRVPANPDVKWRLRTHANVFVHNAGHGGIMSRNGTAELVRAIPLVKNKNIKFIIRVQPDADKDLLDLVDSLDDERVNVEKKHIPFEELWSGGDVFVFPEKFNGLSLPLQEAMAAGMLVMAGDRFPVNQWLPKKPLIKTAGTVKVDLPWIGISVPSSIIKSEDIAEKIDEFAETDISGYSYLGQQWAEDNSLEQLKPEYDRWLRC